MSFFWFALILVEPRLSTASASWNVCRCWALRLGMFDLHWRMNDANICSTIISAARWRSASHRGSSSGSSSPRLKKSSSVSAFKGAYQSSLITFQLWSFRALVSSHATASFVENQFVGANEYSMLGTALKILNSLDGSIVFAGWHIKLYPDPDPTLQNT